MPVIILLVILSVIAIFVKVQNKPQNFLNSGQESPKPMDSPIQSFLPAVTPVPKLQPTLKPSPAYFYTPTPTPAQTPVPTPRQPLLTTKVYLGKSHSDMPESASGDGEIRLMGVDPYMSDDARIASLQYDFNLRGHEAEREYLIYICTILEGGDCVGLATVKTDKSGNASYSGNSGITITKDRPFKAIKVVHFNGGFCSNSGSPCLRGELSLEIKF